MQDLATFMRSKGFEPQNDFTGKIIRFDGRKPLSAWFVGRKLTTKEGEIYLATFCDHTIREKFHWRSNEAAPITPELQKELAKMQEEEKREREVRHDEAAERAKEIYYSLPNATLHPYQVKKGLPAHHHARTNPESGDLIIPLFDSQHGQLCSLQFIKPDGTKMLLSGGKKQGAGLMLQMPSVLIHTLIIAEGYATAHSLSLALPDVFVFMAIDAGNLKVVANIWRGSNPQAKIYIAADNDQWTTKPDGTAWNPGLEAAREAAQSANATVIYPKFDQSEPLRPTDWNDYMQQYGLEKLKEELTMQMNVENELPKLTEPKQIRGYENLPRVTNSKKCPPQEQLALLLSDYFGDNIVRQGDDLFLWKETHWEHQEPKEFKHKVRRLLQYIACGKADDSHLRGTYNMFVSIIKPVPKDTNLFAPNPFATSFIDGTVWIHPKTFKITFTEHKKEDYLTRCLPYKWDDTTEISPLLSSYLQRTFEGATDKDEKIRALQQMAGACLVPCFPHIFFLHGVPGTGKSTIAKLCSILLGKYRGRSQPRDMSKKYGMHPLVNKLVNIHTDISAGLIDDSILKMIEDREPILIERKYLDSIEAHVPAVHIYCCNEMPRSLEGNSTAYDRRLTILEFTNVIPEVAKGEHQRDYEQVIWDAGPGYVVQWAKAGLIDLLNQKGNYTVPDSGKENLRIWKSESDQVGQFLEDLRAGVLGPYGADLIVASDAEISASRLYSCFIEWSVKTRTQYPHGRRMFYAAMRSYGFVDRLDRDKVLHFAGVGVRGTPKNGIPAANTRTQVPEILC